MLNKLLWVLVVLPCLHIQAQTIRYADVHKGLAEEWGIQSIVLPNGERYTLVISDSSFTVDSMGFAITVGTPPFTVNNTNNRYIHPVLTIVKYDSMGIYNHHATIYGYYSLGWSFSRNLINYRILQEARLDNNNELVICSAINGPDSLLLVDANKQVFKTIYSPASFDYSLLLLCKLNSQGQFVWANTLTKKKANPHLSARITLNNTNAINMQVDMQDMQKPYIDTLTLTYTNGNTVPVYINQNDIALTFNTNGSLLQQASPFVLARRKSADSLTVISSVSDGVFSYHVVRIALSANDTFLAPNPLPLLVGDNVVLVKTNAAMQVVWVNFICRGIALGDSYGFRLDYFTPTQQLALGFSYAPTTTVLADNMPIPLANVYKTVVAKFNPTGQLLWYDSYTFDALFSLTFNTQSGGLIMIGSTRGANSPISLTIGNYNITEPRINYLIDFVAFFDATSNQCNGLVMLNKAAAPFTLSKSLFEGLSFSFIGNWYTYTVSNIGIPINDNKGKVYITGKFSDTLELPCNKHISVGKRDGVVLILDPPPNAKDTGVCNSMVSPSGKYNWRSNGLYLDTVLNSLGCDSVLLFKLTILNNQRVVDTSVCYQLVSPSGKYTYTNNGTYVDTIPNHKGCDSVITLKVQVLNRKDTLTISQCKPYKSPSGKYTYNFSGQYLDTLKTTTGCDSVLLINFTRNFLGDTISISRCKNYNSPSGKYTYNMSGQYLDTLTTAAGCDSVLLINFTTQQNASTITINTCTPYITPSGKDTLTRSGTYTDTLTNQFNCDSVITITLNQETFNVQATASNEVSCDTPFTQLEATAAVSYRWSPPDFLSDATSSNPTANPTQNTTYTVTATNNIGCISTDSVEVVVKRVEKGYTLPNVFTPNGDGYNDCFPLVNESKLSSVSFTVYNRWGNEVYTTTNPNACWLGTDNNNNAVPAGVYYYVLTGKNNCGTPLTNNGSIQVLR